MKTSFDINSGQASLHPILAHPVIYPYVRQLAKNHDMHEIFMQVIKRAESGDPRFQLIYAICLAKGISCEIDIEKAKRLLGVASNTVDPEALSILGEFYQFGYLEESRSKAEEIFEKLRTISPFMGCYMLARFHTYKSSERSDASKERVVEFYEKASRCGHRVSRIFYSALSDRSTFIGTLRDVIVGSRLERYQRHWRYVDLRAISEALFLRYDKRMESVKIRRYRT